VVSAFSFLAAVKCFQQGFPEPKTRVFGYFLLPETRFFKAPNPDILKNMELLLHSNISNFENTEVVE